MYSLFERYTNIMKTFLKIILYIVIFDLLSAASLIVGALLYSIIGLTIGIWINPLFLCFALMVFGEL